MNEARSLHNRVLPLLFSDKHPVVGDAKSVAARIARQPELLDDLIECLFSDEAGHRARAASALAAYAQKHMAALQPYKETLLQLLKEVDQWSVRYRLCQILPHLRLTRAEVALCYELFQSFLTDKSGALRTCALQGMTDLAFLEPERTAHAQRHSGNARAGPPFAGPALSQRTGRMSYKYELP
jgi:hypothetical protein